MKIFEIGRDNLLTKLDLENLMPELKDDPSKKVVFLMDKKEELKSVASFLNIDLKDDVLFSMHTACLTTDHLISIAFKFFYFNKSNLEKSCRIKSILSDRFLIIFIEYKDSFFLNFFDDLLSQTHNKYENLASVVQFLINYVYDYYLSVLGYWVEKLAMTESLIIEEQVSQLNSKQLANLRRYIVQLRKHTSHQIENLRELLNFDHKLIDKASKTSFKNIFSKALDIEKTLDKMNDLTVNIYTLYLTVLSVQQNDIMKGLAIVATIFMPITFVTGFFGMNFNMPFLQHPYAWIISIIFMIVVSLVLLMMFRRRNWI